MWWSKWRANFPRCPAIRFPNLLYLVRPCTTKVPTLLTFSILQEEYWKTKLFSSYGDYLTSRGYEPDPESKKNSHLEIQSSLMRLFAVSFLTTCNSYIKVQRCSLALRLTNWQPTLMGQLAVSRPWTPCWIDGLVELMWFIYCQVLDFRRL